MVNYLEFTSNEEVAVMLIVLEELDINQNTTSSGDAAGNVIVRINFVDHQKNPVQFGYDLAQEYQSVYSYIFDDPEKRFGEHFEVIKENWEMNAKKYKTRFANKIAEIRPLFEIDVESQENELDDIKPG